MLCGPPVIHAEHFRPLHPTRGQLIRQTHSHLMAKAVEGVVERELESVRGCVMRGCERVY